MGRKICLVLFSVGLSMSLLAQTELESLWSNWSNENIEDSTRLQSLYEFINTGYLKKNPDSAVYFLNKGKALAQSKGLNLYEAKMMKIEATLFYDKGKFEKSLQVNKNIIKLLDGSSNVLEIENTYERIGKIYFFQSKFDKALKFGLRKLAFEEKRNDTSSLAFSYNNVGAIYKALEKYEKALSYYLKTLELYTEVGDQVGISAAYSNIATIYTAKQDNVQAMKFNQKSLKIREKLGDKYAMFISYYNIALNYQRLDTVSEFNNVELDEFTPQNKIKNIKLHNQEQARGYFNKALKVSERLKNDFLISVCRLGIGGLENDQGNHELALVNIKKALKIVREIGNIQYMFDGLNLQYETYKNMHDYKKALISYEELIELKDSVSSEENLKGVLEQEYKYTYDKQAAIDSIRHDEAQKIKLLEIDRQKTELKSRRTQQYLLFGGLGLAVLFLFYFIKKNKEVLDQKKEVESQKEFAEEQKDIAEAQKKVLSKQHREIRDSINYAQDLQRSVLPSKIDVNLNFPNNFILFKPKDVVSGDFYWTFNKNGFKYLAVVDCTGHGVPGAFMTMVANNLLTEIIQENFNTPKEIIEELHKRIKIKVGGHKDAQVRDSMDLGLIRFNEITNDVLFVGTHTSLSLVRNSKLETIKGSKADIGYKPTIKIEEQNLIVQKDDMLYMHSDGFPDQKGGPKGKKFYYQPIREKFEEISLLNLMEQEQELSKIFEDWKGNFEQFDDVCMIGIRI